MLAVLGSITDFAIYFVVALVLLVLFKWLYTLVTPHDEWVLVKDEQNTAAAIAYGGAIIGFAIAVASAAENSVSLLDFVIWGGVALVAQLVAYFIVRLLFMPKIAQRLVAGEVSAGIILASVSIAVGLLNASCMSW